MLRLLVLLLALWRSNGAITNPICQGKRYLCPQVQSVEQSMTCVTIIDPLLKVHEVLACPEGYYCNYDRTYDSLSNRTFTCLPMTAPLKFPGQTCAASSDCISGSCEGTVCKGAPLGNTCIKDSECQAGLFCSSTKLTCQRQIQYQQSCSRDEQCTNNCVCSSGRCSFYYSLQNGIVSDNKKACKSGYVDNGLCQVPPKSTIELRTCSSNSDCVTLFANQSLIAGYSSCKCGTNGGGYSYCSLVENDSVYQSMIQQFSFVLLSNEKCHTSIREGPCTHLYQSEYAKYARLLLKHQRGPELVYNDKCTRYGLNSWYWKLWLPYMFWSSLMLLVFIVL